MRLPTLLATILVFATSFAPAAQRPNVLFMMADDLSAKNSAFTKQR